MKSYDLITVGGCSAGLAAAISAKRTDPSISAAVFEKLPRVGKKLLATGNGKCNLTNARALDADYTNDDFAKIALGLYPPEKIVEFFASLGVLCREDSEGRVYPESGAASSVADALRFELEKLKIETRAGEAVRDITDAGDGFVVNGRYFCKNIILATGGKASPFLGSDGGGYALARSLGHRVGKLYPSLAPLRASPEIAKTMKGLRARDAVLTIEGDETARTRGEILFTDYGLSGIAAMELAAPLQKHMDNVKGKTFICIDFKPERTEDELYSYLKTLNGVKGFAKIENLLTGILPKGVGIAICKASGLVEINAPISSLGDAALRATAEKIKRFPMLALGTRGFGAAQTTRGGVDVNEIDAKTMSSLIRPGLYFAGEIIDVDGGCGGFNLQWAWASGLLAGGLGEPA